jgi:hypothetical protein
MRLTGGAEIMLFIVQKNAQIAATQEECQGMAIQCGITA